MNVMPLQHRDPSLNQDIDLEMRKLGVVEIAVNSNFLLPRVTTIREGMRRLTDDPHSLKSFAWHVLQEDLFGPKYHQEVGLKNTSPDDDEKKFTFHYAPEMLSEREFKHAPFGDYQALFDALHDLDRWAQGIALAVAGCFDARNRKPGALKRYPGSLVQRLHQGRRIIRVLRYQQKANEAPDAVMHIDRSLFTVHPWSSHPGLRFSTTPGKTLAVNETSISRAAVFPGEKFAAATRGAFGYGTPHGVRDERWEKGTRTEDRYAIVCFTHPGPDTGDAAWLLANRHLIEQHEAKFSV